MALCLGTLLACEERSSGAPPEADSSGASLVARFGELEISAADVDTRILALPPAERPKPGQDLDTWYEEQIRELVVERRLRAEAVDLAEDESFLAAAREAERELAVQLCLDELRPATGSLTDEALLAAYDERFDDFAVPERRDVYHLFLRSGASRPRGAARADIESLRDQVLRGESFQRLAAVHSDSESRHRQGALGWVIPGQLPAGFDDVIFQLDEGVPSEPVATRDGLHLFYVDQVLPARQATFEEVRPGLAARLAAERREAALDELEAKADLPPSLPGLATVVLDRAGFSAVAEGGDPDAIVLRLGGTELTLADLRRRVQHAAARQTRGDAADRRPTRDLAWRVLESLRRRELVYHHCRTIDGVPVAELETRLDAWRQEALLNLQRRRRMVEVAGRDEARLRLFYDSNAGRFSRPPRWHLRRLKVPLGDDAGAVMARLEDAASRGGSSLEDLAAELGGEIEDLGARSLDELSRLEPKLPPLVAPLAAGETSPPYRTASALEMVESVARQEAEPLSFADVHERVAAAYVEQYTREAYREMADEILRTAELQLFPEGFAALRAAGLRGADQALVQADVSVEQLEELLNER